VASSAGASQLPSSKVQRRVPHSCLVKPAPMHRRPPKHCISPRTGWITIERPASQVRCKRVVQVDGKRLSANSRLDSGRIVDPEFGHRIGCKASASSELGLPVAGRCTE